MWLSIQESRIADAGGKAATALAHIHEPVSRQSSEFHHPHRPQSSVKFILFLTLVRIRRRTCLSVVVIICYHHLPLIVGLVIKLPSESRVPATRKKARSPAPPASHSHSLGVKSARLDISFLNSSASRQEQSRIKPKQCMLLPGSCHPRCYQTSRSNLEAESPASLDLFGKKLVKCGTTDTWKTDECKGRLLRGHVLIAGHRPGPRLLTAHIKKNAHGILRKNI